MPLFYLIYIYWFLWYNLYLFWNAKWNECNNFKRCGPPPTSASTKWPPSQNNCPPLLYTVVSHFLRRWTILKWIILYHNDGYSVENFSKNYRSLRYLILSNNALAIHIQNNLSITPPSEYQKLLWKGEVSYSRDTFCSAKLLWPSNIRLSYKLRILLSLRVRKLIICRKNVFSMIN
jgi:hypothetical protein